MLPHFLGLYETGKALIDAGVIPNRNEPVFSLHALTTNRYIIAFEIKEFRDYCDLLVEYEDFYEYCFIQESKEDNILFEFENSFNNYKYIPFEQSVKDSLVCLV